MDFNINSLVTPGIWIGVLVVFLILLRVANIFRYISNNQVGIVEKMWAAKGSIQSGFIALHGEAGFEPEILRGGVHVLTKINQPLVPQFLMSGAQGQENNGGLIPTAMLSSMFGRMMPDALEKLKEEAPKTKPRGDGP
jgi:uncharacterized membrane protein YqiK